MTDAELHRLARWVATQPCALELITAPSAWRREAHRAPGLSRYRRLLAWRRDGRAITRYDQLWRHPERWRVGLLPHEMAARLEPSVGVLPEPPLPMPEVLAFEPEGLLALGAEGLCTWGEAVEALDGIARNETPHWQPHGPVLSALSRADYLSAARRLKGHIRAGDVYELNLCVAFTQPGQLSAPHAFFHQLVRGSGAGMAAYLRVGQMHVLSLSPERLLQRHGSQLCTQPIKGTLPRGASPADDRALRRQLRSEEKFRAENVMIVDLARNDLHRVCAAGSVAVPRLFEVQTYPRLHHLVSTVVGELRAEHSGPEGTRAAVEAVFPPGSMTGAPKVAALKLIAATEPVGRGAYSGAIGYLAPSGDADFNVVIRTLVYDAASEQISWHVGGAITADSDPLAEWHEALLKGQVLREALQRISR